MRRIAKLTRTIAKIAGCKIAIKVFFPKDRTIINRTQRLVEGVQEESIFIDIPAYLEFELPYDPNVNYTERQLSMNDIGKGQFLHLLGKMAKILQKEDVFYIDEEDHIRLYLYQNEPDKFLVKGKVGDKTVALRPVVIEGKDDFSEEGIRLMIKNQSSFVDMRYHELMAVISIVKNADLFMYSQQLINTVGFKLSLRNEEEEEDLNATKSMLDKIDTLETLDRRKNKIDVGKLKKMEEIINEADNENIDDHEDD